MPRLSLYLFGGFHATLDNEPLTGIYDHVRALLAYLATESGRAHRREVLAEMLWPNESEEVARRNLRQALSRLRAALGDRDADRPFLLIDRATIQFNPQADCFLDVAAFSACAPADQPGKHTEYSANDVTWLEEATRLYRGHFLDQFHLPDNPSFDQWSDARGEDYRQRVLHYLNGLGTYHESVGNLQKAIDAARRQIELEPWLEHAHRHLMTLLARSGQRSAALAQYNTCCALLMDELGVDPEPATQTLRQQILDGQVEADGTAASSGTANSEKLTGRRQVTVMYCGLAEPPGMDPEDFIDIVRSFKKRCAEIANRFQAHLEDSHGGAQILFFGFPQAHEDDAQRALHAGLRVVAETRKLASLHKLPLAVRGGIHTGLMVSTGSASDLPVDMIGTPLNVAIQLRYQAEANGLLISADTERLVRGLFVLKPAEDCIGSSEISAALPASHVVRPAHSRTRVELSTGNGLSNFVGREAELAQLLRLWSEARQGHGHVVILEGESGIGKSRLLQVLKRRLARESHRVRQLRCSPDYQTTALHPVIELLHQICGFRANDSREVRLDKLSETLERFELHSDQAMHLLAALLELPSDAGPNTAGPAQQKQQTLSLLAELQQRSSRQQPLLWLVEDLHWVDPSTLELIKQLAKAAPNNPILMLLTVRPGHEHPWRQAQGATHLMLRPLASADVRRLATAVARNKDLPELVLEQIVARTDGVPLFVEELTKTLLESDLLRETHYRYELNSSSPTVALPFTLQDSLMARLDRLDTAKWVAQWGAVLGREFPYRLLADVIDMEEGDLQLELSRLLEAELLYSRESTGETLYGFRHALIQEVAYESLLRRHRQIMHQQVAEILEDRAEDGATVKPEWLAHHYTEACMPDQAIGYWLAAGQQASALFAYNEAVSHLHKGLALLEQLPAGEQRDQQEFALRIAIGVPLMLSSGPVPEIEQCYARALELSQQMPEGHDLFPAVRGLYTYYAGRGDYQTAERLSRQLLRIAQEQGKDELLIEAHRALGTTLLLRGELQPATHKLQQALTLYFPKVHHSLALTYGMDPGLAAFSLLSIVDWLQGASAAAKERVQEALRLARAWEHPSTLGWVLNMALIVTELDGSPRETLQLAAELHELAEKHHMPLWTIWGRIMQDKARAELGEDPDALGALRQAFAEYDKVGAAMGRPYALAVWADTCLKSGHVREGLEIVGEALAWINKHHARLHEAELHRLHGDLMLADDASQAQVAEGSFQRALLVARAQRAPAFELRAAVSLARLYHDQDRHDEAEELLAPVLARFERNNPWRELKQARKLLRSLNRTA